MKNFNLIDMDILESCLLVGPSIQDSSHLDIESLKANNNAFSCPKKISISKDKLGQTKQNQPKTDFNNSKNKKSYSSVENTKENFTSLSYDFTPSHLIDKIFNDLMENGYENSTKQNKYLVQIAEKFWSSRSRSDGIFFEICYPELAKETILLIAEYTRKCKTPKEKYKILNGIMTEVISSLAKPNKYINTITCRNIPKLSKTIGGTKYD
jgi:lysyl-tRNA synthetase class II